MFIELYMISTETRTSLSMTVGMLFKNPIIKLVYLNQIKYSYHYLDKLRHSFLSRGTIYEAFVGKIVCNPILRV